MKKNKSKSFDFMSFIIHFAFFLFVFITLFPLFWMLVTSFKSPAEINSVPPSVFPVDLYLDNYNKILTDQYFLKWFLNSLIVACGVTVIAVSGSTIAGYVFAKFDFRFKNLVFIIILLTIMIPFEATVVPLYLTVRSMKLVNTYWGLMLPSIVSSFGIFFMRQSISQIPDSLLEAAEIDGAGYFYTFRKIVLPLSTSAISVLSILLFLTEWSSYFWPLLVATKKEMFVLEIGLTLLQDEYFIDYGIMMAGCAVALVPAMILYITFRRNILDGIAFTGIKG
ncbi:MAG TPA: carbohydrate ABC transporter permease [Christensenellaceae bacterium]|jgi:multiple sugar transport system permease protein|nr:carbohydrate ABC transporter permease [Christensenellaceae bacterium]